MDVVGSCTYHTRKDGGSGKKEGSKARQARQMLFIVMPMASIDPPMRGATVVATNAIGSDGLLCGR